MSSWEVEQFEKSKEEFFKLEMDWVSQGGQVHWFKEVYGQFEHAMQDFEEEKKAKTEQHQEKKRQEQNAQLDKDDFFYSYTEKIRGEEPDPKPNANDRIYGWMDVGFAHLDSRRLLKGVI